MRSQDYYEDEKIQKDIRQDLNPQWQAQRQMHFKVLHIEGPQKKPANEIIQRAMRMEGFEKRRKRSKF